MRWMWGMLAVAVLGVGAACGGGAASSGPPAQQPEIDLKTPDAWHTLVAIATAGLLPDGLVIATVTPDLREAKMTPDVLRARFAEDPRLAPLLDAIARNDTGALLDTFDFKPANCGGRADDGCPPEASPGTLAPRIITGEDTFLVSAETIRPLLEVLLRGEPLPLTFVSQSKSTPERYLLGFGSANRSPGLLPFDDPAEQMSGLFFAVDTRAARPVQRFDVIQGAWQASNFGFERVRNDPDQQILLAVQLGRSE